MPQQTEQTPAAVITPAPTAGTPFRATATWRFIRHFLEMVVAMVVGMMALAPVWDLALDRLVRPGFLGDHPDLDALVMATNMAIGMTVWMIYRRHSWIAVGQMAVAMYLPFLAFLVPYWAGTISADVLVAAGHLLMLPFMVLAMLLRRDDEFTRSHRKHGWRAAYPGLS